MAVATAPIVATEAITKEYAGFRAIDQVSLAVAPHTIHAIIGPNGAGKTTMFNLLSGFTPPTSGKIFFQGENITGVPPALVARMGIVRSFQINSIFPHLSVLDNVKVSLQSKTQLSQRFLASPRATRALDEPARKILADVGMEELGGHLAAHLPYGRKRSLELAISLAQDPPLLLLDEPTAGMGTEDIHRTIELIRRNAEGRTVVLVEHNLRVVADLCSRITVMQRGRILVEGTYDEVRADKRVVDAYLGGGH
ncbi:MAG: ABC transporter ATP-binding protein [Candidatus Eremiobacteraeota bacterium]|nr:ABC transporter ATP-binding protein [Candidatus Eremiobacteraeota bacterium]